MALYETHAPWRLDVVAGATPRAQPADKLQQIHFDQVHAEIAAPEARLS